MDEQIADAQKIIIESGDKGVLQSEIRDRYQPLGGTILQELVNSGDYISKKDPIHSFTPIWRIYHIDFAPK